MDSTVPSIIIIVVLIGLIALMRTSPLPQRDEAETGQTVERDTTAENEVAENDMDVEDEFPFPPMGFFGRPKLVTPDEKTIEKLSVIKERMKKGDNKEERIIRILGNVNRISDLDKESYEGIKEAGPQSFDDACQIIYNIPSMAYGPTICAEYEGIFFFSGGRTAYPVTDFSSGYAIKKGEFTIYDWYESDLENE